MNTYALRNKVGRNRGTFSLQIKKKHEKHSENDPYFFVSQIACSKFDLVFVTLKIAQIKANPSVRYKKPFKPSERWFLYSNFTPASRENPSRRKIKRVLCPGWQQTPPPSTVMKA